MKRDSGASVYEFFAGGGLARLGLEPEFHCVFANDLDPAKARAYRAAFGDREMREGDVWGLSADDLPGQAALAWASFPCQDLSLAGARAGLSAPRSGAFWGFHRIIASLAQQGRAPQVLALENVCGLLSSRGGADFTALVGALTDLDYKIGALEIDAALFTPQSRPRLFCIAVRGPIPEGMRAREPSAPFHSNGVIAAWARLPEAMQAHWVWWRAPTPPARNARLADILDDDRNCVWHDAATTRRLVEMMSPLQRARVSAIQESGRRAVGAVFKRIRLEDGVRVQRAEARFDGFAGCLRTPAGGSSRQALLFVGGADLRSRLISPREAARLMGAPDSYPLPARANAALKLFGDGVCVPAVQWLSRHVLAPLAGVETEMRGAAL